jgi:hypothetical protein
MFTAIRVAQLALGRLAREDALLLNSLWNSDPTIVVALEDAGWFVEMAADDDPDAETRATTNEFLRHFFESFGFTTGFLAVVREAQRAQFQFVRVTSEDMPAPGVSSELPR